MNEPPSSLPPTPRPFSPERVQSPAGCGRWALVGCGFMTLLLGVAAVVFLFKANDLLGWTLRQIETQLATRMPTDVTAAERAQLTAAFAGARHAIEEGKIDPKALQSLQARLQKLSGLSSTPPTRDEVLALTAALEAVAAAEEPKASPTPRPDAPR